VKYFSCLLFVISFLFFANNSVASALSTDVVIYQVQTGSPAGASQEIVLVINSSPNPVNVSDWCLNYSSASNVTVRTLACVDSPLQTEIWLEPSGIISFASGEYVIASPGFVPDISFTAGIAATGGHIWIENSESLEIDRVGWGSATASETTPALVHTSGKLLSRDLVSIIDSDNNLTDFSSQTLLTPIISGLYEVEVFVDVCPNIGDLQTEVPVGYLQDDSGDCYLDECLNLDELQKETPIGYEKILDECYLIPLEKSTLLITEILPNAISSDTGKEFIEIYNPNSWSINLAGYSIQLGPGFTKQFVLSNGTIGPNQYIVFSDNESKLVLPNSNGVQLRLVTPAGTIVSETPVYNNAPDNSSWVLYEDQWIYSNQPSPNSTNLPYVESAQDEEVNVTTVLAPCPVGKYRNPDTNRCRTIETAVSTLTSCNEDEYRNPETNRCRKLATSAVLAACAAGQERNPETNRCRNISTLASVDTALKTVDDVKVENTVGQINWTIIFIALFSTMTYIIYEWRNEITHYYERMRRNLVQ
jgi:hypothetical protein